jgi:hypothetical protein
MHDHSTTSQANALAIKVSAAATTATTAIAVTYTVAYKMCCLQQLLPVHTMRLHCISFTSVDCITVVDTSYTDVHTHTYTLHASMRSACVRTHCG